MGKARMIKGYEKLEPDERFRLVIQAMARGDDVDAQRLERACQWIHCRSLDLAYLEPMRVAQQFALAFAVDLAGTLGKVRAMTAIVEALPGISSEVFMVGDRLVRDALDLMASFDLICRRYMCLDGAVVLGAFCLPILETYNELTDGHRGVGDPNCDLGIELMEAWRQAGLPFIEQ